MIEVGRTGINLDWTNIKAIAAAGGQTVGLKEDGTVVAIGINLDWTNIKAIAAGLYEIVGLKEDGTVVTEGAGWPGSLNVTDWNNIKAISAGFFHTIGLKEDGTVVAVGDNSDGQLAVLDWRNIKTIAAGGRHTVGLKEDGTVVAVGDNSTNQLAVSGWRNIKAIAAGAGHTVGLKEDGTVVAVGAGWPGSLNVTDWKNIKAIAAGGFHTVGLKEDGTVVAVGANWYGQLNVSGWANIRQPTYLNNIQDMIAPLTIASGGSENWYNTNVISTFTASDNCSGVKEIHYTVNGIETIVPGDYATLTLTDDGIHNITYFAIDNAGNIESLKRMSIKIDKTPPALNLFTNPNILWPPNHKMVDVLIGGNATDMTSGIASISFTLTDEYGIVQPSIGGFNTTILLEAWREGSDNDGRHYTITAVATDVAGNKSTAATTVVVPHDQVKY